MTEYARVTYVDQSGTGPFSVPFPYLHTDHVVVFVDRAEVPFTWLTSSTLQLDSAITNQEVVIRRRTDLDARAVDFQNAAQLTEQDLDASAEQVFYLCQEASDLMQDIISFGLDGSVDAGGGIIENVTGGNQIGEVVTYEQLVDHNTTIVSYMDAAAASASAASASASAASASEIAAAASAAQAIVDVDAAITALKAADNTWTGANTFTGLDVTGDVDITGEFKINGVTFVSGVQLSDNNTWTDHNTFQKKVTLAADWDSNNQGFNQNFAFDVNNSAIVRVGEQRYGDISTDWMNAILWPKTGTSQAEMDGGVPAPGNWAGFRCDGDGKPYHVNAGTSSELLTDAPSDGSEYVRKDGAWAETSGGGGGDASLAANNTWTGTNNFEKDIIIANDWALRCDYTNGSPTNIAHLAWDDVLYMGTYQGETKYRGDPIVLAHGPNRDTKLTTTATGVQVTGEVDMQSSKITNVADGTANGDAVNYAQLLAASGGQGAPSASGNNVWTGTNEFASLSMTANGDTLAHKWRLVAYGRFDGQLATPGLGSSYGCASLSDVTTGWWTVTLNESAAHKYYVHIVAHGWVDTGRIVTSCKVLDVNKILLHGLTPGTNTLTDCKMNFAVYFSQGS